MTRSWGGSRVRFVPATGQMEIVRGYHSLPNRPPHLQKPPLRLRQRLKAMKLAPTAALLFLPLERCTQARRHEVEAKWTLALRAQWPKGFNAFGTLGDPTGNRKWRAWFYATKSRSKKSQLPPRSPNTSQPPTIPSTNPSNSQPPHPPSFPHPTIDLTEDDFRDLVIE
jgi:hypothetical protein